jgi:hypothetical protein
MIPFRIVAPKAKEFHLAIHVYSPIRAQALRHGFIDDGRYSSFCQRRHGKSPAGLSGHRENRQ